jgi:hypothetical protein
MSVDLPQPDVPEIATNSPGAIRKVIPRGTSGSEGALYADRAGGSLCSRRHLSVGNRTVHQGGVSNCGTVPNRPAMDSKQPLMQQFEQAPEMP